jgi:hypothetical protein
MIKQQTFISARHTKFQRSLLNPENKISNVVITRKR